MYVGGNLSSHACHHVLLLQLLGKRVWLEVSFFCRRYFLLAKELDVTLVGSIERHAFAQIRQLSRPGAVGHAEVVNPYDLPQWF